MRRGDENPRGAMRAVIPAATVFYIGRPDFRTIRSTGMRDLDFVQGDASRAARPSSATPSITPVRCIRKSLQTRSWTRFA